MVHSAPGNFSDSIQSPAVMDRAAEPSAKGKNGHAANGRFLRGNKGGPGNPHLRQIARYHRMIREVESEERLEQLIEWLYDQAINGDLAAATLLITHCAGRPKPAPDPDRLAIDERKSFQQAAIDASVSRNPSPGKKGLDQPIANGRNGSDQPSPIGLNGPADSKGRNRGDQPSRIGTNGPHPPSPTGTNGPHPPSPTGRNGPHRPSPIGRNGPDQPIAHGSFNGYIHRSGLPLSPPAPGAPP